MRTSALLVLETKEKNLIAVRPEIIPRQKKGGRGVRLAANTLVKKVNVVSLHLLPGEKMEVSCECGVVFEVLGDGTLQTFSPICAKCAGD